MNPLLVREVQPPLIYVGGDGRLKQHTIEQICLHLLPLLFLLPCSSSSSFFVRSSSLQGGEPRGSRGGQADLGQPIAAARPDGVPPGRVGFRVLKSTRRIACVPRFRTGLLRRELRCITLGVEGTR